VSSQESPEWSTVAVVGAGTIGLGWAALFAARGLQVRVTDPREDLDRAVRETMPMLAESLAVTSRELLDRITLTSLEEAVDGVDLVQETGPEQLEVKQDLFARITATAPSSAVLASSSSGIVATDIAAQLPDEAAARLLIAHPFNPPQVVPLVEVVPGQRTSEATLQGAIAFYQRLGKAPVRLHKEVSGFVANRLQSSVMREAFSLVLDGVVDVEELDTVVKASLGGRWATVGPFESFHLGGGPGGIRHMLEHLGPGMEKRWDDLGRPHLTPDNVAALAERTEATYGAGPDAYRRRANERDRKQNTLNRALREN
jgi:ketoreductase RED1